MFGQDGGDVVAEVRGVVEILDVGAVDAEDVLDSGCRQIADYVVDDPMVFGQFIHLLSHLQVTRPASNNGSNREPTHRSDCNSTARVSVSTSCTDLIWSFCSVVFPLGIAVAPFTPTHVAISF
jgi:hypothetical protein